MISFGDVEVARINLGAGLMASSRPWLCLSYESLEFIDFCFGNWFIWQVVSTKINCSSLAAVLEQTE